MIKRWYNRQVRKWKRTKFIKKIVFFCIFFIVLYTAVSVYLNYELQIELSPTLTTCVYAFFGTELAASAVIRVFDKEDKKSNKNTNNE